jgi:2'-5' RNA ligase
MFSKTGDSALLLLVPEAEPLVQHWRAHHDPSAAEGMPAHITVLDPFLPEKCIDEKALRGIARFCEERPCLTIDFATVGRFSSVLWLDPGSSGCDELLKAVHERWPDCLPYGQSNLEVIPHLTITDGADEATTQRAEDDVVGKLPLHAEVPGSSLMIFNGETRVCRQQFAFERRLTSGESIAR